MKKVFGVLMILFGLVLTGCTSEPPIINVDVPDVICEHETKEIMTRAVLMKKVSDENITSIYILADVNIFPTNPVDSRSISDFSLIIDFEWTIYSSGNSTLMLKYKESSTQIYAYYLNNPTIRFFATI